MGPRTRLLCALAAAGLAFVVGCRERKLQDKGSSVLAGVGGIGAGGPGGAAGAGSGNGDGTDPPRDPCLGESDPRLVIAPQRTVLLTSTQLVNMIRALVDDTEARKIVNDGVFPVVTDLQRRFPPWVSEPYRVIGDDTAMSAFTLVARHAATYVFDNFSAVTRCASATDACAQTFLGVFGETAYRRPLDAAEQDDLEARYVTARTTGTTEDATRAVITAILTARPFLYRSEMGDPSRRSVAPPGLPLTPYELASALSFFLTDGPPDQPLLDDARAGTLPATLAAHADRLLATPAARDWLRTVVEALYTLNQLPGVIIDSTQFPIATSDLYLDLQKEGRAFLDDTLWNASLADLLLSRTTFLNSNLAANVYQVPIPEGATATTFVRTTLPANQRSGILTNAGFLTRRARATGTSLDERGLAVNALLLCREVPTQPDTVWDGETAAVRLLDSQTAQQQVAYRMSMPACASCHVHFDPYGLALDSYDVVGRFRTVDDRGRPIDSHATLPSELGGAAVANAVEVARTIALAPAFRACLATEMLQYAMVDSHVDLPNPDDGAPSCAAADIVRRLDAGGAATFPALMRAVVLSPAFSLRQAP